MRGATILRPGFLEGGEVVRERELLIGETNHHFRFEAQAGAVVHWLELADVACLSLDPASALTVLPEHVPRGKWTIASLTSQTREDIRSADEVLLFDSWRYTVTSCDPDIAIEHEVQLDVIEHNRQRALFSYQLPKSNGVRALGATFGTRRRLRQEMQHVRQSQTAAHIAHIFDALKWDELEHSKM